MLSTRTLHDDECCQVVDSLLSRSRCGFGGTRAYDRTQLIQRPLIKDDFGAIGRKR